MNSQTSVVITQPNYVPWKGYFDLINSADVVVLLDNVQYTRRDWRNRNKIKTADGMQWLTIPICCKGNYHARIDEIEVCDDSWVDLHKKTLVHNYVNANHFRQIWPLIESIYDDCRYIRNLNEIDKLFIERLRRILGVETSVLSANNFGVTAGKSKHLLNICLQLGATQYITGPKARSYLDESAFAEHNIEVEYFQYSDYLPYPQNHGEFVDRVSILDLLFNVGEEAYKYMKIPSRTYSLEMCGTTTPAVCPNADGLRAVWRDHQSRHRIQCQG